MPMRAPAAKRLTDECEVMGADDTLAWCMLFVSKAMMTHLAFGDVHDLERSTAERQHAADVEPAGLEIERRHLHRPRAALRQHFGELLRRFERGPGAPDPQTGHVAHCICLRGQGKGKAKITVAHKGGCDNTSTKPNQHSASWQPLPAPAKVHSRTSTANT